MPLQKYSAVSELLCRFKNIVPIHKIGLIGRPRQAEINGQKAELTGISTLSATVERSRRFTESCERFGRTHFKLLQQRSQMTRVSSYSQHFCSLLLFSLFDKFYSGVADILLLFPSLPPLPPKGLVLRLKWALTERESGSGMTIKDVTENRPMDRSSG